MDSYTFQLMGMAYQLLPGTNTQTYFTNSTYLPVHLQFCTGRRNMLHIWHQNQHKSFKLINIFCKYRIAETLYFATNGHKVITEQH